jgi:hypothetical protein
MMPWLLLLLLVLVLLQVCVQLDELLVGLRPGAQMDADGQVHLGRAHLGALAGVAVPGGEAAL